MLLRVKDVQQVLQIIEENFDCLDKGGELVSLLDTQGRVIARDVVSSYDIPHFNKSTVDGYAVRAKDTFGASESLPALLAKAGEVEIGKEPPKDIKDGECMYVPTGGMLPPGSDAVVMVENTEELDQDSVAVYRAVSVRENTISAGEDIEKGQVVVKKNTLLTPRHIGALSSIGLKEVEVVPKPSICIISTGDELVEPGKELLPGQIWDINSYTLAASVLEDGGEPVLGGIVRDQPHLLKEKIKEAVDTCDAVLVSGGSSAGFRDYTARIIDELGEPGVLVHGISIKPGKPTIIGKVNNKPVIGMPGHPVSSLVVYMVIVSPLVRKLACYPPRIKNTVNAVCAENYPSAPGREEYLMVDLEEREGRFYARPVYGKSGMITTISSARGIVTIPKNIEGIYRGEGVEVILL